MSREMASLSGLLPIVLEKSEGEPEIVEAVVFAAWKKAVGDQLSRHTNPTRLEDKKLVVGVRDETWKTHLESLAPQIIFKLNGILKKAVVNYVSFAVDSDFEAKPAKTDSKADRGEVFSRGSAPESLIKASKKIVDEDLRLAFLAAATGCLDRLQNLEEGN